MELIFSQNDLSLLPLKGQKFVTTHVSESCMYTDSRIHFGYNLTKGPYSKRDLRSEMYFEGIHSFVLQNDNVLPLTPIL